ncbi:hypothetical protein K1719_027129 [Acacia pycnantha]|nr:hypothetical protein K1719_027129 [Acacia pycnantha]
MGFNIQPYGIQSMKAFKEGHDHLPGLDEAVLKNIDACRQPSPLSLNIEFLDELVEKASESMDVRSNSSVRCYMLACCRCMHPSMSKETLQTLT